METNGQVIEILNDLVKINNNRTECYERAADEINDPFEAEIKTVFYQMADESRRYSNSIASAIKSLGGTVTESNDTFSEIYQKWLDLKVDFTGNDILTALQSCQYNDDAVLKAYMLAIEKKLLRPITIHEQVLNQYQSLKASFESIKRYHNKFVDKMKLVS